jgi:GNAT superfamily N-acetyltransferase
MAIQVSEPRTDVEGLGNLAPLWKELHRHHRAVAKYQCLVDDSGLSWTRRLQWYRRLLAEGGSYITATDDDGRLIGYAMVGLEPGPDDTFDATGGIAEVVTLIVTRGHRSLGVGRALLGAAERIARDHGFDTVKIAVMTGNSRAQEFYETNGYSLGEQVLYRRLADR